MEAEPAAENGHRGLPPPAAAALAAAGVRFPTGHEVSAMCAIDALGIAPMFDQVIEVASEDPVAGEAFRASIVPDGPASREPDSAVIVAGVLDRQADSSRGCCPALNSFANRANAEGWLAEHNEVRGQIISIEGAIVSGRAVFRDVFAER
jgi:Alkylmercury lyase